MIICDVSANVFVNISRHICLCQWQFISSLDQTEWRDVIEMHRDYTMIDMYIRVRTSKWLIMPGERWIEWREVRLLVLSVLHRWHQHIECCIRQSQQTRELDRSSYSLSLVQCTTSVSSELCRVSPNDYACKSCFWEARERARVSSIVDGWIKSMACSLHWTFQTVNTFGGRITSHS